MFKQLEIYARVFGERTQEEKIGKIAKFVVLEGLACGFRLHSVGFVHPHANHVISAKFVLES